ncbi:hypothetical protein AMTR_s00027p00055910 [Amborella trichopoda]|uniref:Uncharacterized protein n=1 Tax=Amborella trichopoda TaxID=13333 RepID=W1PTV2_AMBTC|nr:hypothetical protein AMTR_s00027p00055910 [Amborella trichopoda]
MPGEGQVAADGGETEGGGGAVVRGSTGQDERGDARAAGRATWHGGQVRGFPKKRDGACSRRWGRWQSGWGNGPMVGTTGALPELGLGRNGGGAEAATMLPRDEAEWRDGGKWRLRWF